MRIQTLAGIVQYCYHCISRDASLSNFHWLAAVGRGDALVTSYTAAIVLSVWVGQGLHVSTCGCSSIQTSKLHGMRRGLRAASSVICAAYPGRSVFSALSTRTPIRTTACMTCTSPKPRSLEVGQTTVKRSLCLRYVQAVHLPRPMRMRTARWTSRAVVTLLELSVTCLPASSQCLQEASGLLKSSHNNS